MSGYKMQNGNDISTIFESGWPSTGVISGYKLQNGNDITTMFAPINGAAVSAMSGYQLPNGDDIATIFKATIPRSITGLCLWMDAYDSSTLTTSSGSVLNWTDKANGYVFSPINNNNPIIGIQQNGKNTLAFNGSSQCLLGDTNATNFAIGTNSYALFVVAKYNVGASGGLYNKSISSGTNGRIIMNKDGSGLALIYTHPGGLQQISGFTDAGYNIFCFIINRKTPLNDSSYINGTNQYSSTPTDGTTIYSNTNPMLIGAYNSATPSTPTNFLAGNIAEIIAYSRNTNIIQSERELIEGYLAWKWGIQARLPALHPYRNVSP